MPERSFLADNLFRVAPLHSEIGREVLDNMIALYKQENEVGHCPGLELDKCSCAKPFESFQVLKFHFQDVHGYKLPRRKRKGLTNSKRPRLCRSLLEAGTKFETHFFINETEKLPTSRLCLPICF